MTSKGWLSREDFKALDALISKLGFGGYYDFLECIKEVGSRIGAFTVLGGEIDREDVKTISEMVALLSAWGSKVAEYRRTHPEWDDIVLSH